MRSPFPPTIVLSYGKTGISLGRALKALFSDRWPTAGISIWALHTTTGYGTEIISATPKGDGIITWSNAFEAVRDVVSSTLSIDNFRISSLVDGDMGLRMIFVAASWEVEAALLLEVCDAFGTLGRSHVGNKFLSEACLLVPDLLPKPEATDDETHEKFIQDIAGPASPDHWKNVHCLWWLGRTNASGLTIGTLPDSEDDLSDVLAGLVHAPVTHLAAIANKFEQPTHASAGYSEYWIERHEVFRQLAERHAGHLIQRLLLSKKVSSDRKQMRIRASALAGSEEYAGVINNVHYTEGGERIWKGFHPEIPRDEILNGQHIGFRDSLRVALRRFLDVDERTIRSRLQVSALRNRDRLLTAIDRDAKELSEMSAGGLFDATTFVEELMTLVFQVAELPEGKGNNIQEIRRQMERTFFSRIAERRSSDAKYSTKAIDLHRKLTELKRLANIASPPALNQDAYNSLSVGIGNEGRSTIANAIADVEEQIRKLSDDWTQDAFNEDATSLRFREKIKLTEERMDGDLAKLDGILAANAAECRDLLIELAEARLSPWWRFFPRLRQKRAIGEINEKLKKLQGEVLPKNARDLAAAYVDRMQLTIDCLIYEARDLIFQDAFIHLRELHRRLVDGTEMLAGLATRLVKGGPQPKSTLSRSFVTHDDLEYLYRGLSERAELFDLPSCPSAWDLCCLTEAEAECRLIKAFDTPFVPIKDWSVADFMSFLRISKSRLEDTARWMRAASAPLCPPRDRNSERYSVCVVSERIELEGMLQHFLPDAAVVHEGESRIVASVIQLQIIDSSLGEAY